MDAVCVGIGTALADDPLLTARTPDAARQPTRVVFDSEARLPLESQLVRTAPEVPLIVVVVARGRPLAARGAARRPARRSSWRRAATRRSASRTRSTSWARLGIQSMLLEGGPRLAGSFLDAGEVDEMRIFIAPIALGGRGARVSFEGEGADSIEHAQQRTRCDVRDGRRGRADRGAARGVVRRAAVFTGLVQELGTRRGAWRGTATAPRLADRGRRSRASSREGDSVP